MEKAYDLWYRIYDMFYRMITKKRDEWYTSDACTIRDMMTYIMNKGMLRDAQIDAIKTYLFLKIACNNQPLSTLFIQGAFNSMDLDAEELSAPVRNHLIENPAAAALYEYASQKNEDGEVASPQTISAIKENFESINYRDFFNRIFYQVSYTDYLFSLPMGAGKTWLMAAFIYLDLYFAINEPDNEAFAHNFLILAPSGLKSSVIPSLKTIQRFDPTWVLPEPSASKIRRSIIFELLDQQKTDKKSNKTKNPNAQKIAAHQPISDLFGLVAVTNAEKVILNRLPEDIGQISAEDYITQDEREREANELRSLLGKIPSLAVYIDEYHHAADEEIKLRRVVTGWNDRGKITSVIGFSGTPYLEKMERIDVTEKLSIRSKEIPNIVYYYPLIDAIGNFLKKPVVKISDQANSLAIVEQGVRAFMEKYGNTVYEGGLTAKLGIYCGTNIRRLETEVYPLVQNIASEYGLSSETILRHHGGNNEFPKHPDSQMQFESLDTDISKIRIVLLVQIGKEGWDCKSLTGIILSQTGDCPQNMVLQTSCRCLRQVVRRSDESALIYLNESNAGKLETQLRKQHHISTKEFMSGNPKPTTIKRYDRTEYLNLPPVDFYQTIIKYDAVISESANPERDIPHAVDSAREKETITKTTDFTMKVQETEVTGASSPTKVITYTSWLYEIMKGSFNTLSMLRLHSCDEVLQKLFQEITTEQNGVRYFRPEIRIDELNTSIRRAFSDERDIRSSQEIIQEKSSLLHIANLLPSLETTDPRKYYPVQSVVENTIKADAGKFKENAELAHMIQRLKEDGNDAVALKYERENHPHPHRDRTLHYIPYRTDSDFEQMFLDEVLSLDVVRDGNLEVYYNGDKSLTDFHIRCYKQNGNKWQYIGRYTPDFLIIQRKEKKIHKIVIVETKGKIYATEPDFLAKRSFMETFFIQRNNEAFGYERFDFLYLEDALPEKKRIIMTRDKIKQFFV